MEFQDREKIGRGGYVDNYENSVDVIYDQRVLRSRTQPGVPPYNANVIATFDSRFINGQDFVDTNYETWDITAGPPAALTLTSSFLMPAGFVAVVRKYRYEMDPIVPIEFDDLLLDILVNDAAVRGHTNLKHGQKTGWVDTFFIVPSAGTVKTQFRAAGGIASGVGDTRKILIELQGNLIQESGVDTAEEIANPDRGIGWTRGKGRDRV